jgi:hypothetical protein
VDKKKRNILIWSLTWAGLLLAVLYSPFGSPDLYVQKNNSSVMPDVSINVTEITNSPTLKSSNSHRSNNYQEANQSDLGTELNNSVLSNGRTNSIRNFDANSNVGFASSNYSQSSNTKSTSGEMNTGFISLSERSSRNNTNNSQNTGTFSQTGNLGLLAENNLTTTKQSGNASKNDGGGNTDPGGDPNGPPIPVGDGWVFLLFLSLLFALWKMKTIKN